MVKRAQITGQIFIYIMAAIVVGAIILIGYAAISNLLKNQCDVEQVTFKTGLAKLLPKYRDFGSVKPASIAAPCDTTQVCFVDARQIGNASFTADNFIIQDSVQDGQQKNVFLVGESTVAVDYYDYLATQDGNTLCIDASGGAFGFTLHGQGTTILLTP